LSIHILKKKKTYKKNEQPELDQDPQKRKNNISKKNKDTDSNRNRPAYYVCLGLNSFNKQQQQERTSCIHIEIYSFTQEFIKNTDRERKKRAGSIDRFCK
jgi:hypothetical protein